MLSKYMEYKLALEEAGDSVERAKIMLRAVADLRDLTEEELDQLEAVADRLDKSGRS